MRSRRGSAMRAGSPQNLDPETNANHGNATCLRRRLYLFSAFAAPTRAVVQRNCVLRHTTTLTLNSPVHSFRSFSCSFAGKSQMADIRESERERGARDPKRIFRVTLVIFSRVRSVGSDRYSVSDQVAAGINKLRRRRNTSIA